MLAFQQPYTNTDACLYAGTFIQHDNLNILKQYLHRTYLQDCLRLITVQFGVWSLLLSHFPQFCKKCLYRNAADTGRHCSNVVLVPYSWTRLKYVDGHVLMSTDKCLSVKKEGERTGHEQFFSLNFLGGEVSFCLLPQVFKQGQRC